MNRQIPRERPCRFEYYKQPDPGHFIRPRTFSLDETNFRLAFRLIRSIEEEDIRLPLMERLENHSGRKIAVDKKKKQRIVQGPEHLFEDEESNVDLDDGQNEEEYQKMVKENEKWIFNNFKGEFIRMPKSNKTIPERRKGKGSKFGRETQKKYLTRLFARITYSDQLEGLEEIPQFV